MFSKILAWASALSSAAAYAGAQIGTLKPNIGHAISAVAGIILLFTKSVLPQANKDGQ